MPTDGRESFPGVTCASRVRFSKTRSLLIPGLPVALRGPREGMTKAGFEIKEGTTPIIPVMLGDAKMASEMAARLLDHDIYVIGFSFPVVPKGQARIRTQMSAAHDSTDIDRAVEAFGEVGRELGVLRP